MQSKGHQEAEEEEEEQQQRIWEQRRRAGQADKDGGGHLTAGEVYFMQL